MVQLLGKRELPHNSTILLLGMYPEQMKAESQRCICTPVSLAALFTIAESWKQPRCPSIKEWINTKWSIHTVEYYSALNR